MTASNSAVSKAAIFPDYPRVATALTRYHIFAFLDGTGLCRVHAVSRSWASLCNAMLHHPSAGREGWALWLQRDLQSRAPLSSHAKFQQFVSTLPVASKPVAAHGAEISDNNEPALAGDSKRESKRSGLSRPLLAASASPSEAVPAAVVISVGVVDPTGIPALSVVSNTPASLQPVLFRRDIQVIPDFALNRNGNVVRTRVVILENDMEKAKAEFVHHHLRHTARENPLSPASSNTSLISRDAWDEAMLADRITRALIKHTTAIPIIFGVFLVLVAVQLSGAARMSGWVLLSPIFLQFVLLFAVSVCLYLCWKHRPRLYQELGALALMVRSDIRPWPVRLVSVIASVFLLLFCVLVAWRIDHQEPPTLAWRGVLVPFWLFAGTCVLSASAIPLLLRHPPNNALGRLFIETQHSISECAVISVVTVLLLVPIALTLSLGAARLDGESDLAAWKILLALFVLDALIVVVLVASIVHTLIKFGFSSIECRLSVVFFVTAISFSSSEVMFALRLDGLLDIDYHLIFLPLYVASIVFAALLYFGITRAWLWFGWYRPISTGLLHAYPTLPRPPPNSNQLPTKGSAAARAAVPIPAADAVPAPVMPAAAASAVQGLC